MGESEIGTQARMLDLYIVHAIRSLEFHNDHQEMRPEICQTNN